MSKRQIKKVKLYLSQKRKIRKFFILTSHYYKKQNQEIFNLTSPYYKKNLLLKIETFTIDPRSNLNRNVLVLCFNQIFVTYGVPKRKNVILTGRGAKSWWGCSNSNSDSDSDSGLLVGSGLLVDSGSDSDSDSGPDRKCKINSILVVERVFAAQAKKKKHDISY